MNHGKSNYNIRDGKGNVHKVGVNDRCPCNSGKKFKRCCLPKMQVQQHQQQNQMDQLTMDVLKGGVLARSHGHLTLIAEAIKEQITAGNPIAGPAGSDAPVA